MDREVYKLLRKDVELKFGAEIVRSNDCSKLANQIASETNRHISASTIKRFFGIIKSDYNPSKYTLETFAHYIGFENWQQYINYYNKTTFPETSFSNWELLKKQVGLITERSLVSLKLRAGYNPQKVIFRKFAKERIEKFLDSTKTATLFAAPLGYGKSITLIQLFENYFSGKTIESNEDIVLLIDGGIFFSLYTQNANVDLLTQLLDFNISSSQELYFQKNPDQRKGRIVILFDNVDEIYFDKEKYHKFLENLMRMLMAYDNGNYKIIFTCRPENLDVFAYLVNKNPLLETCWFDMDFKKKINPKLTNIPLLSKGEIKKLFEKLHFKFDFGLLEKDSRLLKIISHPYFFSLYIHTFDQNQYVSEIDLIKKYLEITLYSPPYNEEKLSIIDRFVEISKRGQETNAVKKDKLLSQANYRAAYQELISYGIFYELLVADSLFENSMFVKFRQTALFEYAILEKWLQNRDIDIGLFEEMATYYTNNVQLQCNVLKLFVKKLGQRERPDLIEQIRSIIRSKSISAIEAGSTCEKSLLSVIQNELVAIKR